MREVTNPRAIWLLEREWFVGSDHGTDENPDYRYDDEGWPLFVGIRETRLGRSDFHIADGIQNDAVAHSIVEQHNANKDNM